MANEPTALAPPEPSVLRAWCYLVWLSWQRQARSQQMVWIALTLLAFSAVLILVGTYGGYWTMRYWRLMLGAPHFSPPGGVDLAILGAVQQVMEGSGFRRFSRVFVLNLFFGFLLPVWSLAFASEALGGERENNSLVWLLSRPIPRPAIYLAKYLAQLPWSAALNLGGFAILCLSAGDLGRQALRLYWPAVLWATLAFTALFHLFGAFFRRPAILAIVYTFFLEIILNLMPGYLKRVSLTFYARCLVYDEGGPHGVAPDNPINYLPVTGSTAQMVLAGTTVILLVLGAWLFARTQVTDGV
jgi:ABC-2 type transport system permease protein